MSAQLAVVQVASRWAAVRRLHKFLITNYNQLSSYSCPVEEDAARASL